MRINHNITSLNTYNRLSQTSNLTKKSLGNLSSGLRINSASDDAAGLAISEKMRGQIRGLEQVSRNMQDGISLIQTAEGALNEVHSLLQRGRELAVQASNGTLTFEDKVALQTEAEQIKSEVDRIANITEFNNIKLLNTSGGTVSQSDVNAVLENLQKGWLAAGEKLIQDTLGIGGKGQNIEIILENTIDGSGGVLASVSTSYYLGVPGPGSNLKLNIDMADFSGVSYPDGGGWVAYDRVIAHELVHATMDASLNVATGMQTWFMEGMAEAVQGADERLQGTLSRETVQTLVNRIGNGTVWGGTSDDYSMAYAAVRYMDYLIDTNGGNGIKDIISDMSANPTKTLEQAINDNVVLSSLNINSISDFASKFKSTGGGVDFITTNLVPTLSNSDTGSLIGSDRMTINNNGVPTGITYTNTSIVDETPYGTATLNPLSSFNNEIWPTGLTFNISEINIQTGANKDQTLKLGLVNAQSNAIGIGSINLTTAPEDAIASFEVAIETVSGYRSAFGAIQNRLEKAINVANGSSENLSFSESRIRDVDFAKEMMKQTKNSILSQSAQAMLAQANQMPQTVLQLLR